MYKAPEETIAFLWKNVFKVSEQLKAIPAYAHIDDDIAMQVVGQAGKMASEILSPLNQLGDKQTSRIQNGVVTTPEGFKDAYEQFIAGGWMGVNMEPEFGGGGLPFSLSAVLTELYNGANMSFALCPLLCMGAMEALDLFGSQEQKETYLKPLISGEWTASMCLTEAHAGSDVGALSTKAAKEGDHYRITGQKIYITYGEHDFTENIIHLVLARVEGAEEGYKGISLFIVPKMLEDGTRNDVQAISLEHKMGIHASPTAVLSFGEKGGATGYLIGEEGEGLKYMFAMMNHARINVALQGVGIADAALQKARAYASERVQGTLLGGKEEVAIAKHPDVKRMLTSAAEKTEIGRILSYMTAISLDLAREHPDEKTRQTHKAIAAVMTPVAKAYATDKSFEAISEAMQIYGGMGYIEESGMPQLLRDSRIAMIYEGTNGIQAYDLLVRKLKYIPTLVEYLEKILQPCQPSELHSVSKEALETLTQLISALSAALEAQPQETLELACSFLDYVALTTGAVWFTKIEEQLEKAEISERFRAEKQATIKYFKRFSAPKLVMLKDIICSTEQDV